MYVWVLKSDNATFKLSQVNYPGCYFALLNKTTLRSKAKTWGVQERSNKGNRSESIIFCFPTYTGFILTCLAKWYANVFNNYKIMNRLSIINAEIQ